MEYSHNSTISDSPGTEISHQLLAGVIALGVLLFVLTVLFAGLLWFLWGKLTALRRRVEALEGDIKLEGIECAPIRCKVDHESSVTDASAGYVSGSDQDQPDPIQCTIWGKRATILGGSPRILSQAYSLSQDYFSQQNKRLEIKSSMIKIASAKFREELPGGKLVGLVEELTNSNRPTSIINLTTANVSEPSGQNEVSFTGSKELFKHDILDGSGGTIQVSGVRLMVPPGALDKPTRITIGISWDWNKYPTLNKKQALLSPIVICEPQGIKLKKPVELSFPHCAKNIMKDWKPQLFLSETRIDTNCNWRPMTIADYSERLFTDDRATISINHFTLYTLTGESKKGQTAAKDVKILAFAPPLKAGRMHKIRIYCVENYNDEIKNIDDDEKFLNGKRILPRMPLLIDDNGENLCIENSLVSEGWKLQGVPLQELSFELIWHGKTPSSQFVFPSQTPNTKFMADFGAFQKGRKTDCQELHVAQEAEIAEINPEKNSTGLIPNSLRRRLIVLLEPQKPSGNDWQSFAEMCGLDVQEIMYLANKESPVDFVLNQWESTNTELGSLCALMTDMGRHDAAQEISKYTDTAKRSSLIKETE